jgi:hypothetical protein
MSQPCELLEKCGFFENYKANTDVVREGWIRMFCESLEKSERCERKKIRRQTGQPPPHNLAPTGRLLSLARPASRR